MHLWQAELKALQPYSRLILNLGLTGHKERKSRESPHLGRKTQLKEWQEEPSLGKKRAIVLEQLLLMEPVLQNESFMTVQ